MGKIFPADAQHEYKPIEFNNPQLFLQAIQTSYPGIAGKSFFDAKMNDWCVKLRGETIYWAHGRLLRKKDAAKWKNWKPLVSYLYPEKVPNPKDYTPEMFKALHADRLLKYRISESAPNYTFNEIIYQGTAKREIEKHIQKIKFLNKPVWVHTLIIPPLRRVEKKIYAVNKKNAAVRTFLKELESCGGFAWRTIADSGKLSNHSWGSAIDLLPKNYQKKKIYWFWEAQNNKHWAHIQPKQRWSPPEAIIKAFESEGFIWGGKWNLWDNMHFEYRPELLYIRRFLSAWSSDKRYSSKQGQPKTQKKRQ